MLSFPQIFKGSEFGSLIKANKIELPEEMPMISSLAITIRNYENAGTMKLSLKYCAKGKMALTSFDIVSIYSLICCHLQ